MDYTIRNDVLFLPPEKWSQRYGNSFYTIKFNGYRIQKNSFVEYCILVKQGTKTCEIFRRFSSFDHLLQKVRGVLRNTDIPKLPPKTWSCCGHNFHDQFLSSRERLLEDFLLSLFSDPKLSGNSAVHEFLQLGHSQVRSSLESE